MSVDPETLTAASLKFATTADVADDQRRADLIVDVPHGRIVKNRFGRRLDDDIDAVPSDDRMRRRLADDSSMQFVRPMVLNILRNWARYKWSLQGFGMLRAYITDEVRLHVWNAKFAVPNVTTIHDHPWNFESLVVAGQITNTRYKVYPCTASDEQITSRHLRMPFLKSQITCGPGGDNRTSEVKARGQRVWLIPSEPTIHEAGDSYQQHAHEVHHTSYVDDTVTLVRREFLPDTEHAHVFFRADEEWVSAEPREATQDEVCAFIERALLRF